MKYQCKKCKFVYTGGGMCPCGLPEPMAEFIPEMETDTYKLQYPQLIKRKKITHAQWCNSLKYCVCGCVKEGVTKTVCEKICAAAFDAGIHHYK